MPLAVTFPGQRYRRRFVVNGVSLSVRDAEVFGLLGVHGAGKSTLLRMLTTEVPADRGRALLRTPSGPLALRAGGGASKRWQTALGYCPQNDAFIEQMSGSELLSLFARLRGVQASRVPRVVLDFARLVGVEALLANPVESYSGGHRRRLSVAVALIGLPPLVLLDEPTAGVDVVWRKKIWAMIKQLQQVSRISVLVSTHR